MSTQRRSTGEGDNNTRQDLLDATVHIIETEGPGAATSRAISDEADANLGSITYYFGSKDALVATALVDGARRLLAPVIDTLTDTSTPLEQMQRATQLLPEILGAHPEHLRGYVHALAAAAHDPVVRDALRALHEDMTAMLAEQIGGHQAAGIVPAWVDPAAMAAVIVALVDGVAVHAATGLVTVQPTRVGEQFAAILVHASMPGSNSH